MDALRAYRVEAARLLYPATEVEIIQAIDGLELHYPAKPLDALQNKDRWDAIVDDFAEIPLDILLAACRDWRRSTQKFAPSPGQLLALCQEQGYRKRLHARADELIGLLEKNNKQD